MSKDTEDAKCFGEDVIVYCDQHLAPHYTGWCTVGASHKTKLKATTMEEAGKECRLRGFRLYDDIRVRMP